MYCSHCGNQIEEIDSFCRNCGELLKTTNTVKQHEHNNLTNTPAIIGSVFSFLFGIIGLILSIIGYQKADKKYNGQHKKLAMTGIIISEITITWQITFATLIIVLIIIASI